jgi:phosphoribosylformylglycinamidine synthase
MGEACKKFDTPVTGGNVSFYNQNPDGPVYPTPTIGMVGLVEDLKKKMTLDFKEEGDHIFLLGEIKNDINSSQYLSKICEIEFSPAPEFDLEPEFQLQQLITQLIEKQMLQSAHDVSEGGLFVTLIESCFNRNKGFDAKSVNEIRKDAFWFGEAQSRVVVSVSEEQMETFLKLVGNSGIQHNFLGKVTNGAVIIDGKNWGGSSEWKELYNTAIEKHLAKELESEGALGMI